MLQAELQFRCVWRDLTEPSATSKCNFRIRFAAVFGVHDFTGRVTSAAYNIRERKSRHEQFDPFDTSREIEISLPANLSFNRFLILDLILNIFVFRRAIGSRDSWATRTRSVQYKFYSHLSLLLCPKFAYCQCSARSPDRFSISISSILRRFTLTFFSISMLCVLARIKFHKCNGGCTTHR
jgi:hypothetical protein